MVGGWDKSPGPDNDYASEPITRLQIALLVIILIASGMAAIAFNCW